MKEVQAITALAALAQASRLQVFRALVAAGPAGMAAGAIAEQLEIAPTSLSFHLKGLSHSGLIQNRTEGRFIFYSADYNQMNALMAYLTENCCGGNICAPVTSCAVPAASKRR